MDGWVTIGTRLDSKQLQKDLRSAESELKQYEREAERLTKQKARLEIKMEGYNEEKAQIQDLTDEALKTLTYRRDIEEQLGAEERQLMKLDAKYADQIESIKEIDDKIKENAYNQGLVNEKVAELNARVNRVKGFDSIKDSIEGVGKSVERATRRIGHMVLAVFGIRSAFMFVRNAINTISNDDEQLKADIDYMKSALAYTLEPIVRRIVELAKKLMFYVGYIIKVFTGKNIFAKANKGLKSATSGAKALNKELNKTIAGFDEMNVLNDTSSSGSGGAGGGVGPSFDLTNLDNMEVPKWLQWIADHKDEVIAGLAGITAGLIALKLGASGIQALGIGIAVFGLVKGIKDLRKFLKDKTFPNFIKVLEDIALIVGGIALAFGAWPVVIGATIALIVVELVKHFDQIKKMFEDLIKWMDTNVLGKLRQMFGPLGDILYLPIKYFAELAKNTFEAFFGNVRTVINGIVKMFQGDFTVGLKLVFSGLIGIMTAPFTAFKKTIGALWNQVKGSVNYWVEQFGVKFTNIQNKMLAPINRFVDSVKGIWGRVKQAISDLVTNINNKLDKINPIKIGQKAGSKVKNLFGFAHGGVIKLASGGIINQPGRGVPVTSAIAGERGAEGIVPLTDSQQMALLGEAIGKYINLNATIPVYVGNRQIVREIKKIDAENSFASNR